ncbi:YcjF family protein [Brochothrix campestris]|uniref:G domain-containing protein n=1 Tax=Brochothrix campestris FSL F6-1037 TaxID=1265861 RepID=W7CYU5_9LIST|nr:GTP-binding protein [Brochothrix campestris]EUJ41920.1 hypothetical protein BCAMP_01690 [Brochothrix campestris FSL F6-1037]
MSMKELFGKVFDQEAKKVAKQLAETITITMVGDVNAGKSSTINRILNQDVAEVGANPGKTVQISEYDYGDGVVLADTPGLNDIIASHSDETRAYYRRSDIILFFLNAAGTVYSETEKQALAFVASENKKLIIVLNKIDASDDVPTQVAYIREQTNHAYPVVAVSSRTGENIDELVHVMLALAKDNEKELLLAKKLRDRASVANRWILTASASAGGVGASPIPFSDSIALSALQISLVLKLASLYDRRLTKSNLQDMMLPLITTTLGRTLAGSLAKVIPGVGTVVGGAINAGVAASVTAAIGYAFKAVFEKDMSLDAQLIQSLFKDFLKKEQRRKK